MICVCPLDFLIGRSAESEVENPGNNLYVTGLSPRITKRELEKHFASEGNVWMNITFIMCIINLLCLNFVNFGYQQKIIFVH